MPDDVRAALDRLQAFIGRFGMDTVIDQASGFSFADALLLIGEVEMAAHDRRMNAHFPHDDD